MEAFHTHILGHINQDRARAAGAGQQEGFGHYSADVCGVPHHPGVLNDRQGDAKDVFGAMGTNKASTYQAGTHPLMHRTETVDYAVVLEGEIYLVLDKEERLMKQGDFLVERGTNHAWSNRSGKPCKMLFVLIDGKFDPEIKKHF